MHSKSDKHYLRVTFGLDKDNSPEIYDFLFSYLQKLLIELKIDNVKVLLDRLEPLDPIYTNLETSEGDIKNELDGFAKAHHLKEVKGLTGSKKKISLEAKINSNKLSQLFKDYNMLFDIFFTSTKIEAGNLFFDLMDAFNNSLLIVGPKDLLERIEKKIAKKTKSEVLFEYVDSFKQN
ncbi:MAG TPA: hypothetical protein VJK05_01800 [archaeon]|nr:hypothetical protein [archaeon]